MPLPSPLSGDTVCPMLCVMVMVMVDTGADCACLPLCLLPVCPVAKLMNGFNAHLVVVYPTPGQEEEDH